jgi:hypothetical protein
MKQQDQLLLPSKHRAYHNGKTFVQNGDQFMIEEGSFNYIDGEFCATVKFCNITTGAKYEMSDKKFFNKITI